MHNKEHEREPSEEGEAFLPQTRASEDASTTVPDLQNSRKRGVMWYLRILLEVTMTVTIVFLLSSKSQTTLTRETIRRSPIPRRMSTFKLLLRNNCIAIQTNMIRSPKENCQILQ